MGEVSESTMTKRKKKGRPSLLDLQKRSLKKEQQNHHQQRHNSTNVVPHDDDEDERKEKKHKLLVGLNSHLHHPTLLPNSQPFNSDPKRRKIIDPLQTDVKVPKATDSKQHGSQGESGPTTPLPDKKLLLFILDRLQKKVPSKFQPTDSSARAYNSTFNSGGYVGWSEWENEFPASVVKAVLRYGKKQFVVDETRRDTYKNPVTLGNERPVLSTVEDEFKQLLAVGVHMKHSYARSLAHFAADLGPVVWKIAASKISSVLPAGHDFGPGWVSEDDGSSQRRHFPVCDEGRTSDPPVPEDYRSRFSSPSGSLPLANRPFYQSGDMAIDNYQNELNPVINIPGGSESITPMRIQQESMVHSDDFGSCDRLGSNFPSQMKMVRLADLTGTSSAGVVPQMFDMDPISNRIVHTNVDSSFKGQHLSKLSQLDSGNLLSREPGFEPQSWPQGLAGKSSWQGLEVPTKQNSFALANDLNGRIGTTNSPSSNVEAGSQLQPNLALQL
ncbi:hypothetical protein JHK85_009036 [Glycine max]|nr:hypothetical protein JHK85_009036 [Glycine max]